MPNARGQRIAEACDAMSVPPATLARDVGLSRQYLSAIIAGTKSGETFLPKIAERLGVHVAWITTGSETMAPPWKSAGTAEQVKELQTIISALTQQLEGLKRENQEQAERIEALEREKRNGPRVAQS